MANSNFVVHNGLTVGPLVIDAATGSISTPGNINITGNLGVSQITKNDSSISINDTGSSSTVTITLDGALEATVDTAGLKLPNGSSFFVDSVNVLSSTTLGTGVVNSSLTTLGNLTALAVTGTVSAIGQVRANANVNSTSTTTGALTVRGGIGATGNIYGTNGNLTTLAVTQTSGITIAGDIVATNADATALAIALG